MNTAGQVNRYGVGTSLRAIGWAALGVAVLPLSIAQTAQGDIVTVQVSGTVTEVARTDPNKFDLDGSVSVGSPYQLTFVIDIDAADTDPDPVRGEFLLVASSGQLGNYTWSRTQSPVYRLEVANDLSGIGDTYSLDMRDFKFDETFLIDGAPTLLTNDAFGFVAAGISLRDIGMAALDSDALVIPTLSDWGISGFAIGFLLDESVVGVDEAVTISGTVNSITIPEPGVTTIVGLFLAAYITSRRDRTNLCWRKI